MKKHNISILKVSESTGPAEGIIVWTRSHLEQYLMVDKNEARFIRSYMIFFLLNFIIIFH